MRVRGLALIALVAASTSAMAQNTETTNSAGFYYYKDGTNHAFENFDSYKQPTALLITGECNRDDARFADARARGAEVLVYINVVERQETPDVCADYADFYTLPGGLPSSDYAPGTQYARFWQTPQPKARINWVGNNYTTYLLDITEGSAWSNKVVAFVEQLMRDDEVDGVFLDVLGARLWGVNTDWRNDIPVGGEAAYAQAHDLDRVPASSPDWTPNERNAWTDGAVDLVSRIDAIRRAINPNFIVVNNNNWAGNWPGSTYGQQGEQYVDGIAIEHRASTEVSHVGYANRDYSNLGHRRVIAMARDTNPDENVDNRQAEERAWRKIPGVTHTTSQPTYGYAPPPTTPDAPTKTFTRLTDRLGYAPFGRIHESGTPSVGLAANTKYATEFLLSENAILLTLWAYLDGGGNGTGVQTVRLALYRDDHGVPGAKVAESETKWFGPGQPAAWRSFAVPQGISLASNYYWIAIHTGPTAGIVRYYGDAPGPLATNADGFSNGADSTFGTAQLSAIKLSVYATYRIVQ
jgi:hypothetical protein